MPVQVDSVDNHLLKNFNWVTRRIGNTSYLYRWVGRVNGQRKFRALHQEIIGVIPKGMVIDHINGDGLDNHRDNLQVITHAKNIQKRQKHAPATSKYRGVSLCKITGKWKAQARYNGTSSWLGRHSSEESAVEALKLFWEDK